MFYLRVLYPPLKRTTLNSVSTNLASIVLTRIGVPFKSKRIVFVNTLTAAFVAQSTFPLG
jgi:hypothetical protein